MYSNPRARNARIANDAQQHGWSHEAEGHVSLTALGRFAMFRGLGRSLDARNLVHGETSIAAFTYYEYEAEGRAWATCTFDAPFPSPGLRFAHEQGELATPCAEPGFVAAVLEAPVRAILAENPDVHGEWHGHQLVLRAPIGDWNDFVGVAEVVAALMTRVPEMVFEEVATQPLVQERRAATRLA